MQEKGRVRVAHPPYSVTMTGRVLPPARSVVVDGAFDETVLIGQPRGFRAVRHAELAVDVRQVELDRLLGHP